MLIYILLTLFYNSISLNLIVINVFNKFKQRFLFIDINIKALRVIILSRNVI